MARSARKRISYVLPLANSAGGHRLGVNGLAVDPHASILYSGGRDGVICAWDLGLDLDDDDDERDPFADHHAADHASDLPPSDPPPTRFRSQVQAHTHWINDLVLAHHSAALVSASSDITVKVWRPAAHEAIPPETIGLHTDYVKRVASPGQAEHWVASGGLDRKISLWDLNGHGRRLDIHVGDDDDDNAAAAKGSVYALAATPTLIASGGPESVVRVWDARTAKRITKFVGHTDNVRDILVADDGNTILTASSDQTVKVWSMTAGRCMHTLTMHNDSVWSLFSNHPALAVFYSSDRSGIVAKTDVRNCSEWDDGLSVAVCQEHDGVGRVVSAGDYLWTATSSSSINRWKDVDTTADVHMPESFKWHRNSVATTRSRYPSPPASSPPANPTTNNIPGRALLRMSNTAPADALHTTTEPHPTLPVRNAPHFCIEGQNGLMKHHLLNDRRRVLTMDTAGECMLWDLIQCAPIKSFGKRHMEDVLPEVNAQESVAHWCAVDTRIGTLTCVLEENHCFDAEMYADELQLEEQIDFREDHRINLGKWVLRYLFSNLIDEEIKRDEIFRAKLLQEKQQEAVSRPTNIELPNVTNGWNPSGPTSASTLKGNGFHFPHTPGMGIGLATPTIPPGSAGRPSHGNALLTPTNEEGSQLEPTQSQPSSTQDGQDYFGAASSNGNGKPAEGATEPKEETVSSPTADDTPKKGKGMFGKKFKMGFTKNMFATGAPIAAEAPKPVVDDKADDSDSHSNQTNEKTYEDNLHGSILRIQHGYEEALSTGVTDLVSAIAPSLPNDTPVLKPPAMTTILIQEDRPGSGGVADLFEGKVGTLGLQADLIRKAAPMWLGEALLRNQLPPKDIVKVSFVLEPYQNSLPAISADGNNRLNANRMLRARKILAYVAERIEPAPTPEEQEAAEAEAQAAGGQGAALRPHEYLELYCNGQLIDPNMTLASMRAHVWRGGGDVMLHYKANGNKDIKPFPQHPGLPFAVQQPVGVQQAGLSSGSGLGSSSASEEGKPSSEAAGSRHSSQGEGQNAAFGP